MANKIANRVKMSVTGTPAQGSIELATAVAGFQSFNAAGVVNGDTVPYVLEDGLAWELGVGTISVTGSTWTLQRTTVTQSSVGGTTKLNASAATIVMLAPLAADLQAGIEQYGILSDGTTVTWNLDDYYRARVVVQGNRIISLTGTFVPGKEYYLHVIQGAAGGYSLTWDNRVQFEDQDYLTTEQYVPGLEQTAYSSTLYKFYSDGYYLYAEEAKRYPPLYTVFSDFSLPLNDFTTLLTTTSMPSGGSITRSGQAMVYDSTGKLTYAPNNLVTYSEQFDNAAWTKTNSSITANLTTSPDGTSTADKIVENTSSGTHDVRRTISASASTAYTQSAYIKAAERTKGEMQLYGNSGGSTITFDLTAGTVSASGAYGGWSSSSASISNIGNGWFRISHTSTTNAGLAALAYLVATKDASGNTVYTGDGTSGIFIWGAQLEAVTYQTTPSTYVATTTAAYYGPRFDYDPSTLAAKGLLIEGTRTNLCVYSQTTSDANWTVTGGAKTSTNNDDPFGTSTAMLFTASATTTHFIGAGSYSYTSGTVYCGSCFVKAGTASLVQFTFNTGPFGSSQYANFNLSGAGSVTASSGGTGYITQLANGWYRIAFSAPATATAASAAGVIALISSTTDARLPSFASTGTIYATGWQLEIGAFPTSYIPVPTTGSTARAAETFSITGYTNRLLEAYYIDQQTNVSSSLPETVVSSGAVTISPPTFGWVTSVRTYTNAYAGSIASPSWLSFSRSGNAMMTDSTGTLTWAPANMCPYSADIGSANWTNINAGTGVAPTVTSNYATAPDGTSTATRLQLNRGAGTTISDTSFRRMPTTGVAGIIGRSYLLSFYLKATSGTQEITFWLGGNFTPIYQTVTVTDTAWTRVSVVDVATGAATIIPSIGKIGNQGTTATADVLVWGCQIESVTYQTQPSAYIPTTTAAVYGPRYDYDASTVPATPRGLLIEESRANLATSSNDLSNITYWDLVSGVTTTANAAIAPDGQQTAALYAATTANTDHYRGRSGSVVFAAGANTVSIYMKSAGQRYGRINFYGNNGTFDLQAGTASGTGASITSVGNGWYRCAVTATTIAGGLYFVFGIGSATYTGDGVTGIYVWGAQAEAGSFATSYIPTTSASVTRAADVAQWTSAAFSSYWNASAGTIMFEGFIPPNVDSSVGNYYFTASDGTNNNRIGIIDVNGTRGQISTGGTVTFDTTVGSEPTTTVRAGIAFQANNVNMAVSGTLGTLDTAVTIPTVTSVALGLRGDGSNVSAANGWIHSFAYYNQRLPDAILKQKSAIGAPY